jgi:hypothetical protein
LLLRSRPTNFESKVQRMPWVLSDIVTSTEYDLIYQPINLFRVNIAAIGSVLPSVPLMSLGASFAAGSW